LETENNNSLIVEREGIAEKSGTNAGIGAAFPTGGGGISSSCFPNVASNFPTAPPASQAQSKTRQGMARRDKARREQGKARQDK
jgi:hypothetical protein